jgi:glycosyltransferase 2 family protein
LKTRWGLPLGILLTLAALALVLSRWRTSGFSWHKFVVSLGTVDWNWLTLALVLILATYFGRALRWEVMLRPLARKVDFIRLLSATCIGFTAVVLFGRAGEPVRPFLIARNQGVSFSSQVAAWVVERILDILMILIIFGVALTQVSHSEIRSSPRIAIILQAGGATAGVTGAACLALLAGLRQFRGGVQERLLDALAFLPEPLHGRIATFLAAFGEGAKSTRSSSFTLLLLFYSMLEWLVIVCCFYCVFRAFPATAGLGFADIIIVLGFISFGSVVQIPGVGGGMQIVTVLVLTEFYGVGLEAASSIALMLWLINFFIIVPVGLALAFHEGIKWRSLRNINPGAQAAGGVR